MFSGSAPATATSSPLPARRCTACRSAKASGSAYCSPESPATKRPPSATPRASMRRNAHTTSRQGTLNDSRLQSSQATTPQRNSIWCATASASSSLPGTSTPSSTAGGPSASAPGSSDHRPSPIPVPTGARRRASRPDGRRTVRVRHRSWAESRERTAEKASAVTRPRATRSHRPSSTSAGSRPVRGASSGRKQAPRLRRRRGRPPPRPPRVREPPSPPKPRSTSGGRRAARRRAEWPERQPLRPARSERGVRRPHTTSPDRHSSSSQRGSYPVTRAGRILASHSAAGASIPASCSTTWSRPARPSTRRSGAACCQCVRKRT